MNPSASPNGASHNGYHMQQQQQPQHFLGSPWQQPHPLHLPVPSSSNPVPLPQMQPQSYPNPPQYYQNHPSVPFDLPSFPQQIVQDFLRLSTPVGSSHNDDTLLAQALHDSKQTGKTYRQALEALHGINNHAANLWKDYYLDHHDRIDLLVSRLAEQPKTVKKPIVLSKSSPYPKQSGTSPQVARKRYISPPSPSPPHQPPKKKGNATIPSQSSRRKRDTPPTAATTSVLTRPPKRPRATVNSLSAPLPCNDIPNLMPPQVHIPLPNPPSRSPTPPAIVQVGTNGNKYTKQDREYFLRFLVWRLKENPLLTKKELCEMLYEKAPHHSVSSWASHWHQRHDIADKILATYHAKSDADGEYNEDELNEKEEVEVEEEMQDDVQDDEDETSAIEAPRDQKGVPRSQAPFPDIDDTDVDTEDDEADMGDPGSAFTQADWRILAKFIARNPWDEMRKKDKWQSFTAAYTGRTKRTAKAWAEFYRKNDAAVLKLAKRYTPGKDKIRQMRSFRRNKQDTLKVTSGDEDGEYEIEDEGAS